jgi:adenylate cyclase
MAIEIEHKFLLKNDSWRLCAHHEMRIAQAYLNDNAALESGREQCSIRIRITGLTANLNIKSRELGVKRQEFEYPIPLADAESLMTLSCSGLIEKTRYFVHYGSHVWEIDEFTGENAGLQVAEIELSTEGESFERPDWLGLEVTDQLRYYNMALSARPYSVWTTEEKLC